MSYLYFCYFVYSIFIVFSIDSVTMFIRNKICLLIFYFFLSSKYYIINSLFKVKFFTVPIMFVLQRRTIEIVNHVIFYCTVCPKYVTQKVKNTLYPFIVFSAVWILNVSWYADLDGLLRHWLMAELSACNWGQVTTTR